MQNIKLFKLPLYLHLAKTFWESLWERLWEVLSIDAKAKRQDERLNFREALPLVEIAFSVASSSRQKFYIFYRSSKLTWGVLEVEIVFLVASSLRQREIRIHTSSWFLCCWRNEFRFLAVHRQFYRLHCLSVGPAPYPSWTYWQL